MAVFNKDMIDLATKNTNFQKEVYYDENCQVVLMSIEPSDAQPHGHYSQGCQAQHHQQGRGAPQAVHGLLAAC
jgi:hypothetical protein